MNLDFTIGANNQDLINKLHQSQNAINSTIQSIEGAGGRIDKGFETAAKGAKGLESSLASLQKAASGLFAGIAIQEFASKVVETRKEFQSLEVSFSTLLGSAEKGKQLFKEITDYATSTPMLEKDLAKGAQTLLGFGVDDSKVMTYLKELGDVSMGDSEKFNSLTLAFAQVQASGKLMGQDLLQLINAGFNPLQTISEKTGKSIGELKDEMSNGAISAEMVADAFKDATSEGGKFHGMLEAQSKTIGGAISNLKGALQKLFNEIGVEGEDIAVTAINDLYSATNKLTESFSTVSDVLSYCIGAFGGYKAACMLVSASNNIAAASALGYSIKTQLLRKEVVLMQAAQALLNKTMLLNPYVLAGVALGALAVAVYKVATADDAATAAQKNFNAELERAKEKQREHNEKMEEAISIANDESKSTLDRKDALDTLAKAYPSIIQKYIDEEGHLTNILQLKREIAQIDGKNNLQNTKNQYDLYTRYAQVLQKYMQNGQSRKGMSQDERKLLTGAIKAYDNENPLTQYVATYQDYLKYFQSKSKAAAYQYGRDKGSMSMANLSDRVSGMSNTQLQNYKKGWEKIQKQLNESGKGQIYVNGYGSVTKDQVNNLLSQISKRLDPPLHSTKYNEAQTRYQNATNALNRKGMTEDEYQKAKKEFEDAEKAFKSEGGLTNKQSAAAANKSASAAAKADREQERENKEEANNQQKLADLEAKQTLEQGRQKAQAELEARQYKLNALEEGTQKTIAQIILDHDKEKNAIKEAEDDFVKQNEQAARELWEAQNPDADKQNMNWEKYKQQQKDKDTPLNFGLTKEQKDVIDARTEANDKNAVKSTQEATHQRLQIMYDYLKVYGNIEEQKYAIAKEYDEKIAQLDKQLVEGSISQDEYNWRKKTATKDYENQSSTLKAQSLAGGIDWSSIAKGIGGIVSTIADETLKKIDAYMQTDEFKKLDAKNKQTYVDLRKNVADSATSKSTSAFNFGMWAQIEKESKIFQNSITTTNDKFKKLQEAQEKLTKAQEEYDNALKEGNTLAADIAKTRVDIAQNDVNNASTEYNQAQQNQEHAQQTLTDTTEKAQNGLQNFSSALESLTSGSLKGFADGVVNLINAIAGNGKTDGLSGLGKVGGIIGAILSILESIGDDFVGTIDGIVDNIIAAVDSIIEQTSSGQAAASVVANVGKLIIGILSNIVEGAWKTISNPNNFFKELGGYLGADIRSEYEKAVEKYKGVTDVWADVVSDQEELIQKANGVYDTMKAYYRANDANDKLLSSTRKMANARLGEGASMFTHSYGQRMWNGSYKSILDRNWSDVNSEISSMYGVTFNSMSDLANMNGDVLKQIKADYSDLWDVMDSDYRDYLEKIIEYSDTADDLVDGTKEKITGTSFDELKDNFESTLMDMDSSVDDFADDLTEKMTEAFLNIKLGEEGGLYDKLQEWYNAYYDKLKDGELTEKEKADAQAEYQKLVQEGIDIRNSVAALTGYDPNSSQQATANGIQSITADQADQLVGRITAMQIAVESTRDANVSNATQIVNGVNQILAVSTGITIANKNLTDILYQMQTANDYLYDITQYNKNMYNDFSSKLDDINKSIIATA